MNYLVIQWFFVLQFQERVIKFVGRGEILYGIYCTFTHFIAARVSFTVNWHQRSINATHYYLCFWKECFVMLHTVSYVLRPVCKKRRNPYFVWLVERKFLFQFVF